MRSRHTLRAWPLTPIHVGTGEELTPESFALEDDRLCPVNAFATLAKASGADRDHYRKLLKGGDFVAAQAWLAKRAERSGAPIPVGEQTLRDLRNVLDGQSRGKAAIRPFIRDGEQVILPGTSVKGAFRTSWIDQAIVGAAIAEPTNPTSTGEQARALNDHALGIERRAALEQDPFRDVAVVDARIPPGRTRYDRATLGKRDGDHPRLRDDETHGIQMHVERLASLADGGTLEPFEVELDIAAPEFVAVRNKLGQGGKAPKATLTLEALCAAANRFHAELWRYERDRFYAESGTVRLLESLLATFGLTSEPDLTDQLDAQGLVLLRLGRYSQFESKSVRIQGKRYGVKAGQKGNPARFMDEGGTRTTAALANGLAAPFGWLILALPGKGPAGAVALKGFPPAPPSARGQQAPGHAPVAGAPALAGQFRFRKGERVTHPDYGEAGVVHDVPLNATEIVVDFGEGDGPEPSPLRGWAKP